jgi:hypothetical protein
VEASRIVGASYLETGRWPPIPQKATITGKGPFAKRTQTHNPQNDRWVKRDTKSGQFIDQKADKVPFKGVRREK